MQKVFVKNYLLLSSVFFLVQKIKKDKERPKHIPPIISIQNPALEGCKQFSLEKYEPNNIILIAKAIIARLLKDLAFFPIIFRYLN